MYDEIEKFLSEERLKPYLLKCNNNKILALKLYYLYMSINESLYFPLQNVELIMRNSFYNSIALKYGKDWILEKDYLLTGLSRKKDLLQKQLDFVYQEKITPNINDIISNVSFGFWTTFLDDDYEVEIWRPCLRKLFNAIYINQKDTLIRKEIRNKLKEIKKIRNRVFHHENLINFNLYNCFQEIINFIMLLSNELKIFTEQNSNFNKAYNRLVEFTKINGIDIKK